MKQRIYYLDNVKGFAILLVVLGHILPMNTNCVSVWLYSFHLPVFYIVSGILQSIKEHNEISPKAYVYKKAKGVLYPYFVFSIMAIAILAFKSILRHDFDPTIGAFIETISLLGYSALWFLPSFLFSELLFFFIVRCKKNFQLVFLIAALLISGLMGVFDFRESLGRLAVLYYFFGRVLVGLIFIAIGYYVNQIRKKYILSEKRCMLGVIGTVFFTVNIFTSQMNPGTDIHFFLLGNPALFYANAIIGSYGVILLFEAIKSKTPLVFYGRNSLIIMATHLPLPVLSVLKNVVLKLHIHNYGLYVVVVFISCIMVETVIIIIINRYCLFCIDADQFIKMLPNKKAKSQKE